MRCNLTGLEQSWKQSLQHSMYSVEERLKFSCSVTQRGLIEETLLLTRATEAKIIRPEISTFGACHSVSRKDPWPGRRDAPMRKKSDVSSRLGRLPVSRLLELATCQWNVRLCGTRPFDVTSYHGSLLDSCPGPERCPVSMSHRFCRGAARI